MVEYNNNFIEVDTSKGENGVEAGSEGFLTQVANGDGDILINGLSPEGSGPGQDLHLLTIHWSAEISGGSELNISVETLQWEKMLPRT